MKETVRVKLHVRASNEPKETGDKPNADVDKGAEANVDLEADGDDKEWVVLAQPNNNALRKKCEDMRGLDTRRGTYNKNADNETQDLADQVSDNAQVDVNVKENSNGSVDGDDNVVAGTSRARNSV